MVMEANHLVAAAAYEYAALGWKVVPLLARDKRPRINAWQHAASSDEATIAAWFEKWPDSNVGVKLGQDSGIIDVECDDDEAEAMLLRLFDGSVPVTTTFSAARGKHRLFRWRPDLPEPGKAVFKIGKLEFRTGNGNKGAQSVFPPSIHPSGAAYRWLIRPEEVEPAELSEAVMARLLNWCGLDIGEITRDRKPKEHWDRIAAGVPEGNRNVDATSYIGIILRDLADPFDNGAVSRVYQLVEAWNERNKPPLEESALRRTFESVLQLERRRRTDETYERELSKEARPQLSTNEKVENDGWRLVILDAKPQVYLLSSPLWHGAIELNSAELLSPRRIRLAAAEQKRVWVPKSFDRLWEGSRDTAPLGRRLMETAEVRQAPVERHRDRVIAGLLLDQLSRARAIEDGQPPDSRGRPSLMPDGSVVFSFTTIWRELSFSADKVKREEMSAVLEACDAGWVWIKEHRARFKIIPRRGMQQLIELSQQSPPAEADGPKTALTEGKSATNEKH